MITTTVADFGVPWIGSSTAEQGAHNSLVTGSNPVRSTATPTNRSFLDLKTGWEKNGLIAVRFIDQ